MTDNVILFPRDRNLPPRLRVVSSRPAMDLGRDMDARVENMIRIKMDQYPSHWSEAERREMAERALGLFDGDGTSAA